MSKYDFWIRRIHSLLGVLALGGFLMEHLFTNSKIMVSAAAFNGAVEELGAMPGLVFIEIIAIGIPFALHGIIGVLYALKAKNNVGQYGYWNNWMFYLQRITAYIAFAFIIYHVYTLRIVGKAMGGHIMTYQYMHTVLANPLALVAYIVGLLSSIFHFTNGLWGFSITWGIVAGPRSQRLVSVATIALFVLMSSFGLAIIAKFYN
jgi:succinate dehydrogenase / fumarate reductase cytochrome b subunit